MKKVAVTGGLSSGKSSVCCFLKKFGAYTVSADEIVHELLIPQTHIGHQVLDLLGGEILKEGAFDRAKIAEIVFRQPEKLRALEKILHPAVLDAIQAFYLLMKAQKERPLFVAEIPLLFESESHSYFDTVVALICDPLLAKKRFGQEGFEERMAHQLPTTQKAALADFTITNNGTLADLEKKTRELYLVLCKLS